MSIERMSPHQVNELTDSIMQAVKLANAGTHPNDAIIKVASEKGYGKPHVERMIEAFNVSKSIKHRKDAKGEEKAASFSIADPAIIFSKMYPEHVEIPVDTKSAAWEPTGTDMCETRMFSLENAPTLSEKRPEVHSYGQASIDLLMKRACNELYRQERAVEQAKQYVSGARELMHSEIVKLASYFRQIPHEPFSTFEKAAYTIEGTSIKPLMDAIWDLSRRSEDKQEKRASADVKVSIGDRKPYAMLDTVLKAREGYRKASEKCASMTAELNTYRAGLQERMEMLTKFAAGAGLGSLAPFMLGTLLPKGTSDTLTKGLPSGKPMSPDDLTSIDFDAERQGIHTQSMLHDLMTNDEVLRRADPKHVVRAYNDLSTVAPRAVQSPMILRGLLRKAVESNAYDPYELANLVNMETGLKKRDIPDTDMASQLKA